MKKTKFLVSILSSFAIMTQITLAATPDTITLKKSCLKSYPIAVGETNNGLLSIYEQLCDRQTEKNLTLRNELLLNAAQKHQQLGENFKALQLANVLSAQNINSPELTDLMFMAGAGIASNAMLNMRQNENRKFNENTKLAAKTLSESIVKTLPVEPVARSSEKSPSKVWTPPKSKQTTKNTSTKNPKNTNTKNSSKAASPKTTNNPATPVKPTTQQKPTNNSSPFGFAK